MPSWLFALVAGLALPPVLPWLLPPAVVLMVALLLIAAHCRWSHAWLGGCLALVVGLGWSSVECARVAKSLLPPALVGEPVELVGRIAGLVEPGDRFGRPMQRFRLDVESCSLAGRRCPGAALATVQLNLYSDTRLRPDERWRLRGRLKRPHGFANPGGFDYESWLVAQGVSATGSVAGGGLVEQLAGPRRWHPTHWRGVAHRWLHDRLAPYATRPLLLALLVGDGTALSDAQWQRLRLTGTVHLFVVSGLHISLSGGLVLLTGRLWRRTPWGAVSRRAMLAMWLPALVVALLYALLAGFNLPIQRALVMFAAAGAALVGWRTRRPRDAWLLAAVAVLLIDPLAVLQIGFWFSFAAVGVILAVLVGRTDAPRGAVFRWARGWWRVQWACFAIGAPLVLALAGGLPLNSLLANAVAIPAVSLLIMPIALFALLCDAVPLHAVPFDSAGDRLWWLADTLLRWLWRFLEWLPSKGHWLWQPAGAGAAAIACAAGGALLALLPRPFPGRRLAPLMLLPLLFPPRDLPAIGTARIAVLDVGQGLSVLIRTHSYALLYDTGPLFGSGLSAAEAAVAPALRRFGVKRLDELMISHNDSDHAGGRGYLVSHLPVERVRVGEPLPADRAVVPATPCRRGAEWEVDGVVFRLLHPDWQASRSNDNSCVLWVSTGKAGEGGSLLLPGDIGAAIEAELAWRGTLPPSTVVVAPHHGSRSSSSTALIAATRAEHVVFSAGYANPFRHPAPDVVARWQAAGAVSWNTAELGMLEFVLGPTGVQWQTPYRARWPRFWQSLPPFRSE